MDDAVLCKAVVEMERGLIDVDLGGHLYKKRLAIGGSGKRSGGRVIVATRFEKSWFFLVGYLKSEQGDISVQGLEAQRIVARSFLNLAEERLVVLLHEKELEEICHD